MTKLSMTLALIAALGVGSATAADQTPAADGSTTTTTTTTTPPAGTQAAATSAAESAAATAAVEADEAADKVEKEHGVAAMFARIDLDKNGTLDKAELEAIKGKRKEKLIGFDANQDGLLDPKEIEAAKAGWKKDKKDKKGE